MTGAGSTDSRAWMVRPIVWFATASIATTILHELAHACTAYALGVRSTLFNYSANLDLTPAQAASSLPALIRVAGPGFCLVVGMVSWLAFRRTRGSAVELPLLYLSVFGIGTFFGNLMSTSFVGDFSAMAAALGLPMTVRHMISIAGALCVGTGAFLGWATARPLDPCAHRPSDRGPRHHRGARGAGDGSRHSRESAHGGDVCQRSRR